MIRSTMPGLLMPIAATALIALATPAAAQTAEPGTAAAAAGGSATEPAICTDRPTKANSPCTVEPGDFQIETDLFNGSFQRQDGLTTDIYLATNPTLKYGLTGALDVEASLAPYEIVRTHDKFGNGDTLGGVGDLFLRLKYNAYNAKDDAVQVSVIPYVKAPTARSGIGNGEVEGGVNLPVAFKVTDKLSLTAGPELDAYADAVGGGHHLNMSQLINASYTLPHSITLYGELWGDWNYDPTGEIDQYSADVAVAWGVTDTLQLDGGLNIGLNHETPGVQAYVGVSKRF
ncbi:MAG: transporter [Caulobacteraceae bacterium]|nr:transporter [Caulobacter sp.]